MTFQEIKEGLVRASEYEKSLGFKLEAGVLERDSYKDEVLKSYASLNTVTNSQTFLSQVIEQVSSSSLDKLKELIEKGLRVVFNDCDYKIEIVVEDKRGAKGISFLLVESIDGEVVKADIATDEVGGGIQAVVGLLITCFMINTQKGYPLLFIDENLSQLSDHYLPNLFTLLRYFTEKAGFTFVVVTHDARFFSFARTIYDVSDGVYSRRANSGA